MERKLNDQVNKEVHPATDWHRDIEYGIYFPPMVPIRSILKAGLDEVHRRQV